MDGDAARAGMRGRRQGYRHTLLLPISTAKSLAWNNAAAGHHKACEGVGLTNGFVAPTVVRKGAVIGIARYRRRAGRFTTFN